MTDLQKHDALAQVDADKKAVKGSHLSQTELRAGDDVTLYREKRPDDKIQFWGHGDDSRMTGNSAHKYASVVASGNGAGTAGDQVQGDLIVAITDSDGRIKAERTIGDLQELADAADDPRTERPLMEALAPFAEQGRYMEVIVNADEESDGVEVDPSASNARVWYSETSA
jgi:hypothetical protein